MKKETIEEQMDWQRWRIKHELSWIIKKDAMEKLQALAKIRDENRLVGK